MRKFLPFLLLLLLIAAFIQAEEVFSIFYLIFGIYIFQILWNRYAIKNLQMERFYDAYAFLHHPTEIKLVLKNKGIFPVVWVELHESIPTELRIGSQFKYVTSIGPKKSASVEYKIYGNKRGFYKLGPTTIKSGDLLGITKPSEYFFDSDTITIYPQIVQLDKLGLPSKSPFGYLKYSNHFFEDPNRIIGKRTYQPGDSMRLIDWKSSASTGKLLVRQFESSIDLDVSIVLDLNIENYPIDKRYDATELAITTAASLANWSYLNKQPFAFLTNGFDPLTNENNLTKFASSKGDSHLIDILGALARLTNSADTSISNLFEFAQSDLSWGSALVLITGAYTQEMTDLIIQSKRKGINIILIIIKAKIDYAQAKAHAKQFGFTAYFIRDILDLQTFNN